MNASADTLYEKLKHLPPQRLAEVADFVDFLQAREQKRRNEAADRLGAAMTMFDTLGVTAMTAEEIQAEIEAARADCR